MALTATTPHRLQQRRPAPRAPRPAPGSRAPPDDIPSPGDATHMGMTGRRDFFSDCAVGLSHSAAIAELHVATDDCALARFRVALGRPDAACGSTRRPDSVRHVPEGGQAGVVTAVVAGAS